MAAFADIRDIQAGSAQAAAISIGAVSSGSANRHRSNRKHVLRGRASRLTRTCFTHCRALTRRAAGGDGVAHGARTIFHILLRASRLTPLFMPPASLLMGLHSGRWMVDFTLLCFHHCGALAARAVRTQNTLAHTPCTWRTCTPQSSLRYLFSFLSRCAPTSFRVLTLHAS